jgi:NADP-dependent alcohol dehydrogenase
MENFVWHNSVKLVFGKGTIAQVKDLVPATGKIMITYGGGSIKKNGVYDQVKKALTGRDVVEFGGIEANPVYETLMKAVELARKEKIAFLLSVGGGSVLDGTKFVAAALEYSGGDPWEILEKGAPVKAAVPLGDVLTLPATGSEMNGNAVISRRSTTQKLAFGNELVMPRFSILDPETTYTLPDRQTANGIVDTMVHVFEQYLTKDVGNPLNEGIAEAIIRVTVTEGRKVFASPRDYNIRANLMWSATMALNGLIGVNASHDWTSHGIGHELTAFHGLDHGQSLAVVSLNVFRYKKDKKRTMLARYARNVWSVTEKDDMTAAEAGIDRTAEFWRSIGVGTRLKDYGVGPENFAAIADRLGGNGRKMGENGDIGREDILNILNSCL